MKRIIKCASLMDMIDAFEDRIEELSLSSVNTAHISMLTAGSDNLVLSTPMQKSVIIGIKNMNRKLV